MREGEIEKCVLISIVIEINLRTTVEICLQMTCVCNEFLFFVVFESSFEHFSLISIHYETTVCIKTH